MLSVQEFSSKIKQKYPEYQNIDDTELAKKVVAKYPEYQGKVNLNQPVQGGNPLGAIGGAIGGGVNAVVQGGGEVMRGVGNIIGTAGQIVDPVTNINRLSRTVQGKFEDDGGSFLPRDWQILEQGGRAIADVGNRSANTAQQESLTETGKTEDDISTWGGRYLGGGLTDVASSVVGSALGAGLAQKGASLLSKFMPATKAITTAAQGGDKALTFGQKLSQGAKSAPQFLARTAGETQGVLATQGKLATPEDYAWGAGIDAGITGLGKGLVGLSKSALSKIPQFTPTTKAGLGEQGLKRVGELMYENLDNIPLTTSREKIGQALKPVRQKIYQGVEDLIQKAQNKGAKGATIDDMMEGVKANIISPKGASKAGLSLDEIPQAKAQIDSMQEFYKNFFGNTKLNLSQLQELKKTLRYKKGAGIDGLMTAKNQFKEGTRARTKEFIENEVSNTLGAGSGQKVKALNQDYDVMKKTVGTLSKKAPYSGYLTDVMSGSAGGAGALASGNLPKAVADIATAIGVKRLLTSPLTKVGVAKVAKKVQPYLPLLQNLVKIATVGRNKEL